MLATIKLGTYNGSSPLETHLKKLDNCADYYQWSERDRVCHLKASLEGHAGQVLWELGPNSTEKDVVQLLRNRFGNVNQMERFRAELRMRRRKPEESIQTVYQDIRRLLALGFPGQSGELCEIIGRDAFLEALRDPALRIRVLDKQPATLDEALAIVCRMEAYSAPKDAGGDDSGSGNKHGRVSWANSVSAILTPAQDTWIQRLKNELATQRKVVQQLRSDLSKMIGGQSRPSTTPQPAIQTGWPNPAAAPFQTSALNYQPSKYTDGTATCTKSQQRQQQQPTSQERPESPLNEAAPSQNVSHAKGVSHSNSHVFSETYIDLEVNGIKCHALVDTGCDKSLIPRRMVPTAILSPTNVELFAANQMKIPVLGCMRLNFTIQGLELLADLYVSDSVDEFMLGYDWLSQFRCHWFFDESILIINGVSVKLKQRQRATRADIRRVYVRETISIPTDSLVNVPVRLPISNVRTPNCDGMRVETNKIRLGLVAAKALLPDSDKYTAVRFINVSCKQQKLKSGLFFGKAELGVSCGTLPGPTVEHSDAEGVRATAEGAVIDETTDDGMQTGELQTAAAERIGATERISDDMMELTCAAAAKLIDGVQGDPVLVGAGERTSLISKSVPNLTGDSEIPYGGHRLDSDENDNLTRDHPKRSAQDAFTSHRPSRRFKPLKFALGDSVRVNNHRRFVGRCPKWKSLYKEVAVVDKKSNDATNIVKFPRSGKSE